jgi:uncharacterized membrane protein
MSLASVRPDAWDSCGGRPRSWIVPVALVATLAVLAAALFVLRWAGAVSPPPFVGAAPPLWFVFPLGLLFLWLLIVFVVRPWGWNRYRGWGGRWPNEIDAHEVVRLRYARGDISRAQMDELLRDLAETHR